MTRAQRIVPERSARRLLGLFLAAFLLLGALPVHGEPVQGEPAAPLSSPSPRSNSFSSSGNSARTSMSFPVRGC